MDIKGRHITADFYTCLSEPKSAKWLKRMLEAACLAGGASILGHARHQFYDGGMSCVILLAESHCSAHYWPEKQYMSIDIYTCGESTDSEVILRCLQERFEPKRTYITRLPRGWDD